MSNYYKGNLCRKIYVLQIHSRTVLYCFKLCKNIYLMITAYVLRISNVKTFMKLHCFKIIQKHPKILSV